VGKGPEYDLYPLSVHLVSSSSPLGPPFGGPLVPLSFVVASASELYVEEGQSIEVGQLLGLRRPDPQAETVEELLKSREVRSPVSGVIRRLTLEAQEEGIRVEALVEVEEAAEAPAAKETASACPCAVYFTPGDGPEQALLRLIDSAQGSIHLALYYFTDRDLAQALVRAFERGIEVKVLLDEEQKTAKYSKSRYLAEKGIEVRYYGGAGLFHHKFALFDYEIVATGSYNWTASAGEQNEENLIVIEDPRIARIYEEEWQRLWGRSVR
jgi:phosphatidylserine/phosphatidylglycerophosphate/cardiolipin synthase-like enzyme